MSAGELVSALEQVAFEAHRAQETGDGPRAPVGGHPLQLFRHHTAGRGDLGVRNVVVDVAGMLVAHAAETDDPQATARAVRESGGTCIMVEEESIHAAQRLLAHQGYFVEPTSATVVAALDEVYRFAEPEDKIVLSLTGSGLKGSPAI